MGCPESFRTFKIARHCVDLAGHGKCYSLVMSLARPALPKYRLSMSLQHQLGPRQSTEFVCVQVERCIGKQQLCVVFRTSSSHIGVKGFAARVIR